MPEITRFYGIIIKIFFRNEHNPTSHSRDLRRAQRAVLHQRYADDQGGSSCKSSQTGSGVGQTIVRGASKNVGHKTAEKTSSTEIVSSPMIKGDDAHAVN